MTALYPEPGRDVERLESAVLVAVPEAETLVRRWRREHDPSAAVGIPAHITLLYPFLPPEEIDRRVRMELEELFASIAPIHFRLAGIDRFPGVVYLRPEPSEPFERLTAAIATLFPEAPPYGGAHEEVIPHLTIAHTEEEGVLEELEEVLSDHLPVEAVAEEAWLMEERADDRWHLRSVYPFQGEPWGERRGEG